MIDKEQLEQLNKKAFQAREAMDAGDFQTAWDEYSSLSRIPGVSAYEGQLAVFQNGTFVLSKLKAHEVEGVDEFIAHAQEAAGNFPLIYDNLASFSFEVLGDKEKGFEYLEKAIEFGHFKTQEAVFSVEGGYPKLRDDKEMYEKIAHLFHEPGSDTFEVGDLVANKRGEWGVVHTIHKSGKLGLLLIGTYGGIAAAEPQSCRKLRKATAEDLNVLVKYHDNDLHDAIDIRKIVSDLKNMINKTN